MLALDEAKSWLGVSDNESDDIIQDLIVAADEDLKSKVGDYDLNSSRAKLYMKYFIIVNFSDRLGELNNKQNSVTKQLMNNLIFNLRLECESNADSDND